MDGYRPECLIDRINGVRTICDRHRIVNRSPFLRAYLFHPLLWEWGPDYSDFRPDGSFDLNERPYQLMLMPPHGPIDVALHVFLLHGFPLVKELLTFADSQQHFGTACLEVQLQGD